MNIKVPGLKLKLGGRDPAGGYLMQKKLRKNKKYDDFKLTFARITQSMEINGKINGN